MTHPTLCKMEEITKHYLISGRVQGVGYRAYTARQASRLDLRGWVRNLADGRVEAVAKGSSERIKEFESCLREGPPHGQVETLMVKENADALAADCLNFDVRKDGVRPCVVP